MKGKDVAITLVTAVVAVVLLFFYARMKTLSVEAHRSPDIRSNSSPQSAIRIPMPLSISGLPSD